MNIGVVAIKQGPVRPEGGAESFSLRIAKELSLSNNVLLISAPGPSGGGFETEIAGELFRRYQPVDKEDLYTITKGLDLIIVNQWRENVAHPAKSILMLHGGFYSSFNVDLSSPKDVTELKRDTAKIFCIAACSNWAARTIRDVIDRDVATIYPPLGEEFIRPVNRENRRDVVAYVGRISKYKGADLVPAISEKIASKRFTFEMTEFVPDSNMVRFILNQKALGNVKFIAPFYNENELVKYYNSVKMLLVPSRVEGFGLSALEAQVSGVFVIANNTEGLVESVYPEGGFLVEGDVESYALAIEENYGKKPSETLISHIRGKFSSRAIVAEILNLL